MSFFFLKEKERKRSKKRAVLSLVCACRTRKSAPLPERKFCSYLTKFAWNREAKYRFTDLLWSANRAIGANSFDYWAHHFAERKNPQNIKMRRGSE
jgi:hypothetical protein